jgi:outer membrane lipoprotein LolB
MKCNTHIWLLFFVCLLSGCFQNFQKTLPTAPEQPSITWEERKASLEKINHWDLRGKAGFQSPETSGSAAFQWHLQQDQYQFSAFSPLGSETFNLTGNNHHAVLKTAEGKRYEGNNSEELLNHVFGFSFPLSSLVYWIRGLPDPRFPNDIQFDTSHRITTLAQAKWQIHFMSYTKIGAVDLPSLIKISSPSYKTSVVIYDWKV